MEKLIHKEIFLKYEKLLSQDIPKDKAESFKKENDIHLQEFNCIVTHLDDFISFFTDTSLRKSHIVSKLSELIVEFGLVNSSNVTDKVYESKDFPCTAQDAEKCFHYLKALFTCFEELEHSHRRQIIINCLLLCATHSKIYLWSSANSVTSSADFLASLLTITNHEDLLGLLCDDNFHPTIFKGVLKTLRPMLMKETWNQNPSACYLFSWFLHHVKHPYLADFLSDIFPPPLMFLSHYQVHHKLLGIQCLDHILLNVPPTLMKIDGKDDVIYHTLSPCLYSKEQEIVAALFPCLLKLPTIKTQKMTTSICWSNYDHVLHHLLITTEMEFTMKLKLLYLTHIHSFLLIVPPFKHLKRLLSIVEDNLCKENDIVCKIKILEILRDVIKSCWPRMKHWCFKIMKSIIILLHEIEDQKDQEIKGVLDMCGLCEDCLTLLKCSCTEEFQNMATKYIEDAGDRPGVQVLKCVLEN